MKALIRLTLLLACTTLTAVAQDIVVEKDVAVPMRDGVVLRAEVWRPAGPGPFPVLVYRTPYNRQPAQRNSSIFPKAVERGYAVVIQDVRGRYGSDGEYLPYQQEGRDGYDTIEWAAAQPWSNGAVGTFGLSYPGAVQWLAALERPPHLKAMVPAMTFATPSNFWYSGGVFDLSWIAWIWNNIAPNQRVRKNLPGPQSGEEARAEWERSREALLGHLPLSELPQLKDIAPYYYEWMRHPPGEKWWDWAELRNKYDRVGAAVLNLSGWYDEAYGPDGALNNFNGLVAARKNQPHPRTKVIMGPWVHGVSTIAETAAGERQFGPAAKLDYNELILRWMDHYLRGIDNGVEREKPVEVYVMGADRWRQADRWPLPETRFTPLYLNGSSEKKKSLRWEAPKEKQASSAFVSDA
ncbi:MAG: CocE/NonD family hydrolase, partial [Candidatus Acidiferrales bacterium]